MIPDLLSRERISNGPSWRSAGRHPEGQQASGFGDVCGPARIDWIRDRLLRRGSDADRACMHRPWHGLRLYFDIVPAPRG